MQNLKQELQSALKDAMKAKDSERRNAIRLLQSAIKQAEIDGREELDDEAVMDILRKEAKKRLETIGSDRRIPAAATKRRRTEAHHTGRDIQSRRHLNERDGTSHEDGNAKGAGIG